MLVVPSTVAAQTLTGLVVDGDGAPIAGASVTFSGRPKIQTSTDAEGRFSLVGQITNGSRLIIRSDGFAMCEREVVNNGVWDFTIILQPELLTGNVTVSIARTETRLNETPASVVALTRETLDSTAAQTIDDSLRQIAGFNLFRRSSSKTSNPTTQGANLRGVSGSGAARTTVLFDGLSLNDAFGGWTYWSRVPQAAVEQVEVLRGGASSLYGSGGLSGAINLRPIGKDGKFLRLQTSAGTQNTFDISTAAGFAYRKWAFDFSAEAFKTDGYIPVAEDERGLAETRANSKHKTVVVGAERQFLSSASKTHGRVFAQGNLFSEDRENGTSLTTNGTYFRQAAAGFDLSNETAGRFELRTFLQAQVYDQTFSAVAADRNSETLSRLQRVPSQSAGGSLFWTRAFSDHTIASSLESREVRGYSDEVGYFGGSPTSKSGSGGKEKTIAFFAQDLWKASDRVSISFGGRFDRWRNVDALSVTRTLSTNAVTVTNFPDRNESAFSPRIAALVSINESVSAYGSYSRSFRAPTLNELYRGFRVGSVVTQSNEKLTAEIADTVEGGINITAFQDRVSIRGNAFQTQVGDPIVSITLSTMPNLITRRRQNVGETRTRGLEVDAEFAIRPELHFSASYLFADSRFTSFPADPTLVGNYLPQVARQQFNFQLSYRPVSRFSFGVQGRVSSSQFEDDINTLRLRSFFTVDATAAVKIHKNSEIFIAAENVFNNRYDIGLTPNRTVAAPAFARFGLRLNLGKR